MEKITKYTNWDRSREIVAWLSDHPLISRNALCMAVGYDTSNLLKAFDGSRAIPAKYLDAFETELAKYGYEPPK